MGKLLDAIDPTLAEWLHSQHLFFVASAPLAADGHVNVSPKGYDSFRVLDDHTVAYLDLTGSGAETVAHLRENGRITLMFCAFEGAPRIVRLHGTGEVVLGDDQRFADLVAAFPERSGARAVIRVDVVRISSSCGFAVPLMDFEADRETLAQWSDRKTADELSCYRAEKNATSIDGLPAIP